MRLIRRSILEASDKLVRRLAEEPLATVFMSFGSASRFERSLDGVVYHKLQHAVVNEGCRLRRSPGTWGGYATPA